MHGQFRIAGYFLCVVVLIFCFPGRAAAGRSPLEQKLFDDWHGKTLRLRGHYCNSSLKFDAAGQLVGTSSNGDWSICRDIMIEDLIVSHDHLRITGRRIAWYYDSAAKKFRDGIELGHRTGKGLDDLNKAQIVVLEMALPPTPDQEQIEALFKKISMELTPAMIVPMPERPVPAPEAEAQSTSEGPHTEARPGSPIARVLSPRKVDFKDPALPEPLPGEFSAGPGFYYHVGNGVSAPKPLYTPAPQFSEMARRFAFQGVVVLVADIDAEGRVAGLQVLHSIGMGLDAKALEMVRTWKFGPSLKDGVPVPTQMNIEVSFNLY